MSIIVNILLVLIILCLLLILYINTYNHYQSYIIRINEAEANIDTILRKRFDLLNKSVSIIKANCDYDGEILGKIVKLRSRKLSNFDLDKQLYDEIKQFNFFKDNYEDLRKSESFMKIAKELDDTEAETSALRKYYNDTITDYNKLVNSFPTNIIGRMCKYKEKTYFESKVDETIGL